MSTPEPTPRSRLHYVNKLAWWVIRSVTGVSKVSWRSAFVSAQSLLRKREWRLLRVLLSEHFKSLSFRYFSQGDVGRGYHFRNMADTVLDTPSWAAFTRRDRVGPSTKHETLEFVVKFHTTRSKNLS